MSAFVSAFQISWDPGLRGILVVLVGASVLMGSVYLLLATNLGARLGFLIAVAGLTGWMMLMGVVWAIYGIGYKGPTATWKVEEIVSSSSPTDLAAARLEKAHDLSKWRPQASDDPHRGEEQAAASAALVDPAGLEKGVFTAETDFIAVDAYDIGGKKHTFVNNWLPGPHPPHYSVVQVRRVLPQPTVFGQAPPPAKPDPSSPVWSVIMVRDLGAKRLPPVTLAISMGIVFAIACNALHRRDKQLMAARAAVT
ncbi:MAG: hypothetical protein JF603_04755 [Acidobacteria bacterium]|nr:hypothetical protein [Acidobacteriota bacterium]